MKKKEKNIEIKKVLPAKLIFFCVAEIWMVFLFGKLKPKVMFAAQTPFLVCGKVCFRASLLSVRQSQSPHWLTVQ